MPRPGSAIPPPRWRSCWWGAGGAYGADRGPGARHRPGRGGVEDQPKVVGADVCDAAARHDRARRYLRLGLLRDYTPGKLAAGWCSGAAVGHRRPLNLLALWKQETARPPCAPTGWRPIRSSSTPWRLFRARAHGHRPAGGHRAWNHGVRHGRRCCWNLTAGRCWICRSPRTTRLTAVVRGRRADRLCHRLQRCCSTGPSRSTWRGWGHVDRRAGLRAYHRRRPDGRGADVRDRHLPLQGLAPGLFGHGTLTATMRTRAARAGGPGAWRLGRGAGDGGGHRRGAWRRHPRPDPLPARGGRLPPPRPPYTPVFRAGACVAGRRLLRDFAW